MKIKFASFNLFQFVEPPYSWYIKKDTFTTQQWNSKLSWIKNQIIKMDAHIIGFQEVFSKNCLEKLCKELGYKYFVTVDNAKTNKKNPNIYTSTIVALASKYPIKSTKKIRYDLNSLKKHYFKEHFSFSRIPIKAIIELPNKRLIAVYVNHFKSNRLNEFEYIFTKNDTLEDKMNKTKIALKQNYSPALKQRLCEASSLFYDINESKLPVVFLCDLNDKEYSLSIEALSNNSYHDKVKDQNDYILFDAYYYFKKEIYNPHPEQKELKRTPTSYYLSYGNVIDYIFVSKELKENIINYKVFDEHLQINRDGSLLESDHAQVVCEIEFK